jgi:hypothetical protein
MTYSKTMPGRSGTLIAILILNILMQPLSVASGAGISNKPISHSPTLPLAAPVEKADRVTEAQLGEVYGKLPLSFERNQGQVDGAAYELRLFTNGTYTRLATSNSFRVEAATLSVSPTTVSPLRNDWIGLYESSGTPDSSNLILRFTGGQASGSKLITIPAGTAAGTTYELRLFNNGGYTRLAVSNSFTVLGTTLNVSPTTITPGGVVTATWSNIGSPSLTDWIGLYSTQGAGNLDFLSYRYTNGQANGNVPFTIPTGTAAGTTYELRLFTNGSFTRLATSNTFTIQPPMLTVSPTTVAPGGSITATWSGVPVPTATDWIGLYTSPGAANTAYLSYRYTNGLGASNLPFTIPASAAAGTSYELRLFSNNGYTRLARSNSFAIVLLTLTVSPARGVPGGSVNVAWTNIPSPSALDWIGLYAMSGTADTSYISYRYTNGQASGSMSFPIPVGTPAGTTYELRLFSNHSYTRLATSNSFTVITGVGFSISSAAGEEDLQLLANLRRTRARAELHSSSTVAVGVRG